MRQLFGLTLVLLATSGCIIVPARPAVYRSHRYHRAAAAAAPIAVPTTCPPSYHWDGYACVHNGNGRHGARPVR